MWNCISTMTARWRSPILACGGIIWGAGLGKHLLSYGVARAWEMDAKRVWLHTCNLDGPHALANYQKRGFRIFKVVEEPMPALYS